MKAVLVIVCVIVAYAASENCNSTNSEVINRQCLHTTCLSGTHKACASDLCTCVDDRHRGCNHNDDCKLLDHFFCHGNGRETCDTIHFNSHTYHTCRCHHGHN